MSAIKCPSCSSEMKQVKEPDVTIDECSKCGGRFLDKNELNILATGMAGDIEYSSIEDSKNKNDQHTVRSCAKCANQKMDKINLLAYSDIIFDHCPKCGGFFMDKGEIRAMNQELSELTKNEVAQEFRGFHDKNLVRVDRVHSSGMSQGSILPTAAILRTIQVSVYFQNPFNLDLRISNAKWTTKLAKALGLFKGQDILTEDDDFDKNFIVQGSDDTKIKKILTPEIRRQIKEFVTAGHKIILTQGSLEILDNRVVYTEGPYQGEFKTKIVDACQTVILNLLSIARKLES